MGGGAFVFGSKPELMIITISAKPDWCIIETGKWLVSVCWKSVSLPGFVWGCTNPIASTKVNNDFPWFKWFIIYEMKCFGTYCSSDDLCKTYLVKPYQLYHWHKNRYNICWFGLCNKRVGSLINWWIVNERVSNNNYNHNDDKLHNLFTRSTYYAVVIFVTFKT